MKSHYEKITPTYQQSFTCFSASEFNCVPYHHHKEIELTFIAKGHWQRYVGHHIDSFYDGDVVVIGSMLAHTWKPAKASIDSGNQLSYVLQFDPNVFGDSFWTCPELSDLKCFLADSRYGLALTEHDHALTEVHFKKCIGAKGAQAIISFLQLWDYLLPYTWSKPLSTVASNQIKLTKNPIIETLIEHLLLHYSDDIKQSDLAAMASMSISHFSRFFKRSTGYSFNDYLNRIRIEQACHRLMNTHLSIAQVAFDVGYRNLSQFNLNFKKINKFTPKDYLKTLLKV